ncbi:MAG TPA: hypothetical protein VF503_27365 [Sphingobium sp.]|uniref:hypothetical protein n=1 Tax=Sphingobium sp. TaxID=1912891 RepID=UPI002ED609C9
MTRTLASPLFLFATLLALSACNGSKPAGGGNVAMRDMEVVDGTANDSMADLDNATQDGTSLSNAIGLPGAVHMNGGTGNASASPSSASNGSESASSPQEKNGNASTPE